jgi:hypothetical protein
MREIRRRHPARTTAERRPERTNGSIARCTRTAHRLPPSSPGFLRACAIEAGKVIFSIYDDSTEIFSNPLSSAVCPTTASPKAVAAQISVAKNAVKNGFTRCGIRAILDHVLFWESLLFYPPQHLGDRFADHHGRALSLLEG